MVVVYVLFTATALAVSFFFVMIWRSVWTHEAPHPQP